VGLGRHRRGHAVFEQFFHIDDNASLSGWANSCALIGCLVGALVSGLLSDRFGRKRLLIAAAVLFAVTSVGNGPANSFGIFIACRILGGVAIGLASSLSPMHVALGLVDRCGRCPLMLLGSFHLAALYGALGFCYYFGVTGLPILLLVLAAIACYAMSLASVTWVIISEIFPNRIRGAAMVVAVMALWLACFILTYTFPIMDASLGASGTLWLYGAICVLGGLFVFVKLPETNGRALEEIERDLTE
jgi:MFS family permease